MLIGSHDRKTERCKYSNRERRELKETKLWQQHWYWKAARSLDTLKPSMVSGLCLRAFKSLPQALGLKGWETLSISFMPFVQPGHVTWIRVIGKKIAIHAELCTGWFHQSDKLVILRVLFCSLISSSLLSRCDYHSILDLIIQKSEIIISSHVVFISAQLFSLLEGWGDKFFMVVLMPILAETQLWRAAHYDESSLRRLAQTWCFWSKEWSTIKTEFPLKVWTSIISCKN